MIFATLDVERCILVTLAVAVSALEIAIINSPAPRMQSAASGEISSAELSTGQERETQRKMILPVRAVKNEYNGSQNWSRSRFTTPSCFSLPGGLHTSF